MNSDIIDLDAYPILRIDQIPLIDADLLHKAQNDVKHLLNDDTDRNNPTNVYLERQLSVMNGELMRRAAEDRVKRLLRGDSALDVHVDGIHHPNERSQSHSKTINESNNLAHKCTEMK